jgi:hypothetical protein
MSWLMHLVPNPPRGRELARRREAQGGGRGLLVVDGKIGGKNNIHTITQPKQSAHCKK